MKLGAVLYCGEREMKPCVLEMMRGIDGYFLANFSTAIKYAYLFHHRVDNQHLLLAIIPHSSALTSP